jgi:ABC-type multidrug transport system permease subunit
MIYAYFGSLILVILGIYLGYIGINPFTKEFWIIAVLVSVAISTRG